MRLHHCGVPTVAKRGVKRFRPTRIKLDGRYATDEQIAELIRIVGALPDRQFQIEQSRGPDEPWEVLTIESRPYLVRHIESAARTYHWEARQGDRPTPAQLVDKYGAIEQAARRLLHTLHVTESGEIEKMPWALRYGGLAAQAHKQAAEAGGHHGPLFGDGLLRQVIEGVRDLRQWADAALERELAVKARQPQSQDRHEGNTALNDYLKYVVVNSWWAIWGIEIRDNARILAFMCAAAAIVGVELTRDAARKRLRTIFAETFRDRRDRRRTAQSSPT